MSHEHKHPKLEHLTPEQMKPKLLYPNQHMGKLATVDQLLSDIDKSGANRNSISSLLSPPKVQSAKEYLDQQELHERRAGENHPQ